MLRTTIPYIGEIFALAAPITWSFAVILFRKTGDSVGPFALNLFKIALALVLYVLTLYAFGGSLFRGVPAYEYLLLVLSGAIGIGLSDTLFLMALNRIGAGLWAIVNTSYSPSIIFLSVLFLGERLTLVQSLGVVLILGAVLSIILVKGAIKKVPRRDLIVGCVVGVLAMVSQAVSIVMVKRLLEHSPLLWANSWRMLGGFLSLVVMIPFIPGRNSILPELLNRKAWKTMIPSAILGSYIALMFWLGGMKYTQASTASVLNQTGTLWTFILAAILLKEPVSFVRVLGLVVGFGGVLLVTFGG